MIIALLTAYLLRVCHAYWPLLLCAHFIPPVKSSNNTINTGYTSSRETGKMMHLEKKKSWIKEYRTAEIG